MLIEKVTNILIKLGLMRSPDTWKFTRKHLAGHSISQEVILDNNNKVTVVTTTKYPGRDK